MKEVKDKYKMSQDENIFIAKRLLVDSIYKSANLEGIAVTFAQTIDILNDINVDKIKPSEIGKVCCLRDAWNYISGTSWRPEIPIPEKLHKELLNMLKIENCTDRALTIMLWIMRTQFFKDGNKRVATLIANKILIENGCGIFSVPVELDGTFKSMLVLYYETNNMNELKEWLYNNCIDGINQTKC